MKLAEAIDSILPLAQAVIVFKDNIHTLEDVNGQIAKGEVALSDLNKQIIDANSILTERKGQIEAAQQTLKSWNDKVIARRQDHDQVLASLDVLQKRISGGG